MRPAAFITQFSVDLIQHGVWGNIPFLQEMTSCCVSVFVVWILGKAQGGGVPTISTLGIAG